MADSTPAAIPTRLEDLFGFSIDCTSGRTHSVEIEGASVRRGALDDLVPWARRTGRNLSICVVSDRVTRALCGERVEKLLGKDGHRVSTCLLPDGAGGRPHADEPTLAVVEASLSGADLAVAVGAGTVNDLCKLASDRRGISYLVAGTAPSMNGYTSAIAAVMLGGVKRTVACHQPQAVIADLDILLDAPAELVAAGLGDLESKPTATADYRLAGLVRDAYYCPAPEGVVMEAEARVAEAAEGLRSRDPQAMELLCEALLLSGISMKLAGTSSPASGGEHLISHYWDMTAPAEGRVEGWHGAQVGVATIMTAGLYERLRHLRPDDIDVDALAAAYPAREEVEARIRAEHGELASEVIGEFFQKWLAADDHRRELERIRDDWDHIWSSLAGVLRPADEVRAVLAAAGAPTTVEELGLRADHLERALRLGREIRGRYTVLDFAASLGRLTL